MQLEDFKQYVTIIPKDEAKNLRSKYIDMFINTEEQYFKKYIESTKEYSDGTCYIGYLWDCLKAIEVIDMQFIKSKIDKLFEVLVFWDIHSKERIFIKDYWKFSKHDMLNLNFKTLIDNLEFLPEDIYIFDRSFEWTIIITHEYVDEKRWCLKSGIIGDQRR